METIITIFVGIVASVVASCLFLFGMLRLKPKIQISPYVAKSVGKNGDATFWVKFTNRTRSPLVSVRCEMTLVQELNIPGGRALREHPVALLRSKLLYVERYDRKDKTASYAWRLSLEDNLEEIWGDDATSYLLFSVTAVHSVSGFGSVFMQKFHTKRTSIKEGAHRFGYSLDVA